MNDNNLEPAFSVIIPTHNRVNLLPRAIKSVLNQTFQEFELIIVDDASTDETPALANSFADQRIVYVRREANGSAAAARNTGIRRARGQYISMLDDDDEYLPQFLAETYQAFEESPTEVGFGWCGVQVVEDKPNGEVFVQEDNWRPDIQSLENAYLSFLRSRRIGTNCGITVRRSCFETVGLFDETMKKAEDTDFLIRIARLFDFIVVPKILIKIHHHASGRLTTYDETMAKAYERIIEKNFETLNRHSELWAELHYKTGWLHYHSGNKTDGRRFIGQALRRKPWHLKSLTAMLLFELFNQQGPWLHQQYSARKARFFLKNENSLPD